MSRLLLFAFFALVSVSVVSAANAQEAAEGPKQAGEEKLFSGPIVITSDTLLADGARGSAIFTGSVVAKGDDFNMKAEKMKVLYGADGGALQRIEADGSVKLVRAGRIITSERAIYDSSDRKVTFTGNARAVEGGNVLVGTKIIYMIDDDRYEVEGSKIFLENRSGLAGSRQDAHTEGK